MAIYQRPHSVQVPDASYLERYGSAAHARQRLFNVGAGSWFHPLWTNIDLPPQTPEFAAIQAPCLKHDLVANDRLPLESSGADLFYCSHVIEHLPEVAVRNFFTDAYRCLAEGGVLRIVTGPCADLDWSAMRRGDRSWWFWMDDPDFAKTVERDRSPMSVVDRWLYHLATPRSVYSATPCDEKFEATQLARLVEEHADAPDALLDRLTDLPFNQSSPGDHISWWNYDKIARVLSEAGFSVIERSAYGQSRSPFMRDLRHFDQTYPQISVYAEAVR
jgi:predicted SAM-dependent methyltransferase